MINLLAPRNSCVIDLTLANRMYVPVQTTRLSSRYLKNMSKPYNQQADLDLPEGEQTLPSGFPIPPPITGTVDDDDDPADERADENEASVREQNENTDATAEFQHDDEDRDDATP